ncbi:DinB family protein [Nibribacter koreensis]|uniref:DinB family protein n=1 Tax=Nibribacter koreensis TaxID=1084519 RepID=A0ABP8FFJ2_9BACT
MELNQVLLKEFTQEAKSTRRMLERIPADKFDWKPHTKSMPLGKLAAHVAEIPEMFVATVLRTQEMDFVQQKYTPFVPSSTQELLAYHDQVVASVTQALTSASTDDFAQTWTLRHGMHTIFTRPKADVIRSVAMNHLIHHRGQLSVYLRLLDVPVPGMYGPTADDVQKG